jgi:hypothetical protein
MTIMVGFTATPFLHGSLDGVIDSLTCSRFSLLFLSTSLCTDAGLGQISHESLMHENMKPHCGFKDFAVITSDVARQKSAEAKRVVKTA